MLYLMIQIMIIWQMYLSSDLPSMMIKMITVIWADYRKMEV